MLNPDIVTKADKGLVVYQYTNESPPQMKPCAICKEIHVEMSEYEIGFFLDGTNNPVCLGCAKEQNPLIYYLWEMGVYSHSEELLMESAESFNHVYFSLWKRD